MKISKRLVMIGTLLPLLLGVFFLPSILCQQPIMRHFLAALSEGTAGKVEVQSCSLGWVEGFRCNEPRYQNTVTGLRLTSPKLVSDKGLLLLLLAPRYFGEITFEQPVLTFLPIAKKQNAAPREGQALQGDKSAQPWWERLSLRFKVHKGLAVLEPPSGAVQELARAIELSGSLADGSIDYALTLQSGLEQQGSLRAEGFVNLPSARQSLVDTLISRTDLEIKELELAALLDLAASRGNSPKGRGVLNAKCHLTTAGLTDLVVDGEMRLREVRLAGGFLGQDKPRLDHLWFKFKGSHRGNEGWRLAAFDLDSEPVQLKALGNYDHATAFFKARGSAQLAVIAAQFPHLLSLHEKTSIKEGSADFDLQVTGIPQDLTLKAQGQTDRLTIVHNSRPYSWNTPFSLVTEAEYQQGRTRIATLQARSPFFEAKGNGDADNFTVRATADIGKMLEELGKIFALSFQGKGKLEFEGRSQREEKKGYRLESNLAIDNFSLVRNGLPVLLPHNVVFKGDALTRSLLFQPGSLASLRLEGDSWPGKWLFSYRDEDSEQEKGRGKFSAKGNLDLARMNTVAHGLLGISPSYTLGGGLQFEGDGQWGEDQFSFEAFEGVIDRLTIAGQGYSHQEPHLKISLGNKATAGGLVGVRELMVAENWQDFLQKERSEINVQLQQHRVSVNNLAVENPSTSIQSSFSLAGWHELAPRYAAELKGSFNAAFAAALCKAAGWFPKELAVQGRAHTALRVKFDEDQKLAAELAAQIKPFELFRNKKSMYRDNGCTLNATLQADGDGDVNIPSFTLQTSPLHAEGSGLIKNATAGLALQGKIRPHLAYFANALGPVAGQKFSLAGKGEGMFSLSVPFKFPVDWNRVILDAKVPVEALHYRDFELRDFEMPLELRSGKLRMMLTGTMNGGALTLQPQWNFGNRQLTVESSPAGQVLKGVAWDKSLQDALFGKMHPLFGGIAQPEGTIDLRIDNLSLPFGAKNMKASSFSTVIDLSRMRVTPVGPLKELLELAGIIDLEKMSFKENAMHCSAKGGRIVCAPVHLLAGEREIEIDSTVGMDRTLSCRIQMPLTAGLAERIKFTDNFEGAVRAEIAGTVDAPLFDSNIFLESLPGQLAKRTENRGQPKGESSAGR